MLRVSGQGSSRSRGNAGRSHSIITGMILGGVVPSKAHTHTHTEKKIKIKGEMTQSVSGNEGKHSTDPESSLGGAGGKD